MCVCRCAVGLAWSICTWRRSNPHIPATAAQRRRPGTVTLEQALKNIHANKETLVTQSTKQILNLLKSLKKSPVDEKFEKNTVDEKLEKDTVEEKLEKETVDEKLEKNTMRKGALVKDSPALAHNIFTSV